MVNQTTRRGVISTSGIISDSIQFHWISSVRYKETQSRSNAEFTKAFQINMQRCHSLRMNSLLSGNLLGNIIKYTILNKQFVVMRLNYHSILKLPYICKFKILYSLHLKIIDFSALHKTKLLFS